MKSLVLFSCVAAATANLVTYPNGAVAPVETPEVQAAKAAHFAAKGLASPLAYAGLGHQGYATGYGYAAGYGYAPYALQAHPNGAVTPVDEPAVQVAKAQHFAAKNAEYAAHGLYAGGYAGAYAGAYAAAPVAYAGYANQGYAGYAPQGYAAGYGYAPQGYAAGYGYAPYALQAHPNGAVTPVDEPAVQAAKAQHFAAKNAEYAAHGLYSGAYAGAPLAYAAAPAYYGPALTVHANGAVVPVEPLEVQEARAAHLAQF